MAKSVKDKGQWKRSFLTPLRQPNIKHSLGIRSGTVAFVQNTMPWISFRCLPSRILDVETSYQMQMEELIQYRGTQWQIK